MDNIIRFKNVKVIIERWHHNTIWESIYKCDNQHLANIEKIVVYSITTDIFEINGCFDYIDNGYYYADINYNVSDESVEYTNCRESI